MEFLRLNDAEDFRYSQIFDSYSKTFPEEERRSEDLFRALLVHPKANIFCIFDEISFIGYAVVWELSHFTFLEHLEVFEQFRNMQYGSKILSALYEKYGKIALESEPPKDAISEKRIAFYERNGYFVLDENYRQPSYGAGKNPVPMYLLGNWHPEKTEHVAEEIYEEVYH